MTTQNQQKSYAKKKKKSIYTLVCFKFHLDKIILTVNMFGYVEGSTVHAYSTWDCNIIIYCRIHFCRFLL